MDSQSHIIYWAKKTAPKLKFLCLGLLFALVFSSFSLFLLPKSATADSTGQTIAPPTIKAKAAIAVDEATGKILFSQNMYAHLPMASTTKLTTALTVLSIPGVNLGDKVTVNQNDLVGEASMGLRLNETVTVQDLLWGMLLNSGNDAAQTLADYGGSKLPGSGDNVSRFVAQMNTFAQTTLGLTNTHYANPHGLDQENHYTSAYDLARVGWYVLHNPLLAQIVRTQTAVAAGHTLRTLNTFLGRYPGAIGIKPGDTDNAGLCLVAAAVRGSHTIITVVLNSPDIDGESAAMMDYGFSILENQSSNPLQGGGPAVVGDPSQYVGVPQGDKLLTSDQLNAAASSNNPFSFGQVAEAQVISGTNSSLTPNVTTTDGSNSNDQDTVTSPSKGGLNFFFILLLLIVICGVLYVVARMGYLGGDRGRDIAFRVEDGFIALSGWLRHLLNQVKPGNNDADNNKNYRSQLPPPRSSSSSSEASSYRDRVQNTPPPSTSNSYTSSGRMSANSDSRSAGPSPRPPLSYQPNSSSTPDVRTPQPPSPLTSDERKRNYPTSATSSSSATTNSKLSAESNPLDGFFDDISPFDFEEKPVSNPNSSQSDVKPPSPLRSPSSSTTSENFASRPATPEVSSEKPSSRPPTPRPLPTEPTASASRSFDNDNIGSSSRSSGGMGGTDSLAKRAQQAIDYAFAGRVQASTDEFRRVVEQNPLFDFGGLDDFEQMPVLGYKALANAYHDANKTRFAVLLLDMAIEKFPNDLELRNMARTFRRESD